ncbi:ATP-binding cassette sub- G member 1 [Dinochytrium kinnereticum]|nr:ATP-binding cassette sub- G member 1 [Dinochytrium kinnereticum]
MSTNLRSGEGDADVKGGADVKALEVGEVEDGFMKESRGDLDASNACQIVFRNLCYSINIAGVEGKKKMFRPGRFTAIMGASGAGKTSFLNVIAGEARLGQVSGDILVNGTPIVGSRMKQISGHDDAISMSATLRLPKSISPEEKKERVEAIIKDLNLTKCADTIIGDAHIKGVSGGERKRCAMAMEMVTNPKVLFLDEPTSGLDTFTAFSVIHTLRGLAHRKNQTYIATIHQPSSQLFRLFDDLLLLSEGRVMYYGKTQDAVPYFSQHHFSCPVRSNPADYFFYHILNNQDGVAMPSTDKSSTSVVAVVDESNSERIVRMLEVWEGSKENGVVLERINAPISGGLPQGSERYRAPLFTQFEFLFNRESKYAFRDPLVLQSRLVQTVFLSLIVGLLYLNNTKLAQNAMGVLFFISVVNVMLSSQAHLTAFGKQKAVFTREHGAGYYSLPAFFMSKILVEMPMQIMFPWIQITIVYWMAGLEANVGKYFILVGITILASISGFALGVCLACSFSSLPIALVAAPLILLPLMYSFEGSLKSQVRGTKDGDMLINNLFGDADLSVTACCLLLIVIIAVLITLAYLNLSFLVNKTSKTVTKKT